MYPQTDANIKIYGRKLINAPFNKRPACGHCNGSHRNVIVWDEPTFRKEAIKAGFELMLPEGSKTFIEKTKRGAWE